MATPAHKLIGIAALCLIIDGCGVTVYPPGLQAVAVPADGEHPDTYRADSSQYPRYAAVRKIEPPMAFSRIGAVAIEPADIWRVTHKVGDTLLIFSDSYQQRQCLHLTRLGAAAGGGLIRRDGTCVRAEYEYYVHINPDGHIANGMMRIRNPERGKALRPQLQFRNSGVSAEWGSQPVFRPVDTP